MEINENCQNEFPQLGIGTMLWMPKSDNEKDELFRTYQYCMDRGYNFFDTAEIYGNGKVESLLGEFIKKDGRPVRISSKFAPPSSMNPLAPKRKNTATDSPEAIWEALEGSLMRLGIKSLDLYLMHNLFRNRFVLISSSYPCHLICFFVRQWFFFFQLFQNHFFPFSGCPVHFQKMLSNRILQKHHLIG